MNHIYALRDKHADCIVSINIFNTDLIAYREYMFSIEKMKQNNPLIKLDDYEVIHIAEIDREMNIEQVRKVITAEYVMSNIPNFNIEAK